MGVMANKRHSSETMTNDTRRKAPDEVNAREMALLRRGNYLGEGSSSFIL